MPPHFDAIDHGVGDAGAGADRTGDLGGRDVLALPAEGVADAVDESEIAARILAHQIAGAEPTIARREHVAQELALARCAVGITVELPRRRRRRIEHAAD